MAEQQQPQKDEKTPEKRYFPFFAMIGIGAGVVIGICVTLATGDGSNVTRGFSYGLGFGVIAGAGVDSWRFHKMSKAEKKKK
ncbi:MAG: hypothetical protein LKF71_06785 [Oscillospiraceae bacterium]|nr:hypothetical protein [Oscillospiraceae bacterium]